MGSQTPESSETPTEAALGTPVGPEGHPLAFDIVGEPFLRTVEEAALRVKFPVNVAGPLGTEVVVAFFTDLADRKWLAVFPVRRWTDIIPSLLEGKSDTARRDQLRALARYSEKAVISSGRLSLPRRLASMCGISAKNREVTLRPRFDRVEIEAGNRLGDVDREKAVASLRALADQFQS
jgi:hypothetical protein